MDFLTGLNAQQREAVTCTEGPLLILAGAGSGKTRDITHRIAYIVTARHVPALLEGAGLDSTPRLSTFHSFCVRLLRMDGDPLTKIRPGFTRRFTIYDEDDQLAIVKAAYRTLGLEEKE